MTYFTLKSNKNPGSLTVQANNFQHAIERAEKEFGWQGEGAIIEVVPYVPGVHEIRPVARLED